jgi:signal transduction histidine kinase/CheY-like chemotaxis protein
VLDITARKRAEQALMARERELREAHGIAKMGHWQYEIGGRGMTWASSIYEILEYPHDVQPTFEEYLSRVHPDDRDSVLAAHRRACEQLQSTDVVHRLCFTDQRIKHVRRITRTERAQSGQPARVLGIIQDVTELREAELQRARLEAQLHQAQKMEAVGYLAGGIAHDFNNLLTVIGGNASLALIDSTPQAPTHEPLSEILKGVESAAELTRRLLTFSRKQVIEPRVVNLNDVVRHMGSMLKRLLGEDLLFMTHLDGELGQVRIDLSQAEQILVNLAVNARDAMQLGGKLTIETLNVELDEAYCQAHPNTQPGAFVMLAVSDNGIGMSPETKQHIFEPFFTTKSQGQGTGLGLAMVYGAVLQNGGSIEVYSELGRGTTFKIYLPRIDALAEALEPAPPLSCIRGHETIVIVEDDERVRTLCARVLRRQGYTVHAFRNGEDALVAIASMQQRLDLVITDVVMPGMNGRMFSEQVQRIFPGLRVLYTSGYTQNVIAQHGVLEPGINFLAKPYSYEGLAKRIRELLDAPD